MNMPGFNGPLVVGSVFGYRHFSLNTSGRNLGGVAQKVPWRNGENVCVCRFRVKEARGELIEIRNGYGDIVRVEHTYKEKYRDDPHSIEHCTCGFYAFFDPINSDYRRRGGLVPGVIEGYGETVLGTRGFRAQKARIVGLVAGLTTDPRSPIAYRADREGLRVMFQLDKYLRKAYPDATIFRSLREMTKRYPPKRVSEIIS